MKRLLVAFAALSLTACQTFADPNLSTNAAATSEVGSVQSKAAQALIVAWRAFDTILTAVDGLQAAGAIEAGSPRALRIANALDTARNALNAATNAVRAGNGGDFTESLTLAHQALTDARAALGER